MAHRSSASSASGATEAITPTSLTRLPRNLSAPIISSPLHDTSSDDGIESSEYSAEPGTPLETTNQQSSKGSRSTQSNPDLTPPDSSARGSQTSSQKASGVMGSFSFTTTDDPFVTPNSKENKINKQDISQALAKVQETPTTSFTPRQDRIGQEVNAENAQGLLTPKACVFVANLSNQRTDDQLQTSVKEVFGAHGNCYVKIRRDRNKMPFAFVQYESAEAANDAINKSRGAIIDNRPTRCEHAKVNRALYITRHTGGPISDAEAHELLEPYGAIESTSPISIIDQHLFNLPEGIMVQFAYFQDARDAHQAMKHHDVYRVAVPLSPFDFKSPAAAVTAPSPQRVLEPATQHERRHTNDTSVWIGNLPLNAQREQVRDTFSQYGQIQTIDIVNKPAPNGNGTHTFAFVSFQTPEQADAAIHANVMLSGQILRVERKEHGSRRVRRNGHVSRDNEDQIINALYHQGLQMGLSLDLALRILDIGQNAEIEHGSQSWVPPPSPMNHNMYYSQYNNQMTPLRPGSSRHHDTPHTYPPFQYPMGYNIHPMSFCNQYMQAQELEDGNSLQRIPEAEESNIGPGHVSH